MKQRAIDHGFADESFRSEWLAVDQATATIIVFPTVAGISELEQEFGEALAGKGYNVFLADLYGADYRGAPREVGHAQMRRLSSDRASLRQRLLAVLETVREIDDLGGGIVAIGFCFGGLCALDLARSGADIAAVASFHGLFDPPPGLPPGPIKAKVAAYHGWDDPLVPPQKVGALTQELTRAGCDWQLIAFGNTVHGFTNKHADRLNVPSVRFSPDATRRSWHAFDGLLAELFGDR